MSNPEQKSMLVAFSDLTLFARTARSMDDLEIFQYLDEIYRITGRIIESHRGRVVKFIGDASMIVFEERDLDRGIVALLELREEVDRFIESRGYPSRMHIKAAFGPMAAGVIGTDSEQRFDVFGNTVNIAAMLETKGFAITVETFRKLKKETRQLFKKHTPPVTYISVDDRH